MTLNIRQSMIADAMKVAGEPPYSVEILAPLLPTDFALEQIDIDEMPIDGEFTVVEPSDGASKTQSFELTDLDPDTLAAPVASAGGANAPPDVIEPQQAARSRSSSSTAIGPTEDSEIEPPAVHHPPPANGALKGHLQTHHNAPAAEDSEIEAAEARVTEAADVLANARVSVMHCQRAEREMNSRLAKSITQFQSSFAPYTPEQQSRDFIRSEMQQRARIAAGELPPARAAVGNSQIDRQRAWARGSGPDSGQGNSGRALDMQSGKRVYPQSSRGAYVGPPKVPSKG